MLLFISKSTRPVLQRGIFQYISCYCLSVFLMFLLAIHPHFNTSHVTVYQWTSYITCSAKRISIHLMLLFIVFPALFHQFYQDISIHLMLLFIDKKTSNRWVSLGISIHLMLLFINSVVHRNLQAIKISIHLMLLFISPLHHHLTCS